MFSCIPQLAHHFSNAGLAISDCDTSKGVRMMLEKECSDQIG